MKGNKLIAVMIMSLDVGMPARIVTTMGMIRTSKVEHCHQHDNGIVWIETENTKYTILPI